MKPIIWRCNTFYQSSDAIFACWLRDIWFNVGRKLQWKLFPTVWDFTDMPSQFWSFTERWHPELKNYGIIEDIAPTTQFTYTWRHWHTLTVFCRKETRYWGLQYGNQRYVGWDIAALLSVCVARKVWLCKS